VDRRGTALRRQSGLRLTKVLKPKEALVEQMPWASDFSARNVHGTGVLEGLGAVGGVVPGGVGVATGLVPLAAFGLALLQVRAVVTNVRNGEIDRLPINVVLFALAAFVAWGRFGPYPL
jgi:hypothetical protein